MRNSIYEMLFVCDDLVQLGWPEFEQHGERYVSATQLFTGINLLATCHQVHYEGRTVLYGRNIFSAKHRRLEMMAQWLESIGSNAAHVKRVLVDLKDQETRTRRTESLELLRVLWSQNLMNLEISFVLTHTPGMINTSILRLDRHDTECMPQVFSSLRDRSSLSLHFS
jgi:hypothetical protein